MQPSLLGLYQAIIVSSLDGMDMGVAAPWIPKVGLGKSQLLLLHKPGGSFLATALKPPSSQRGVIMIARGRVRIRTQVCLPEGGLHLLLTGLLQGEEHTRPIRRHLGGWQIPQPRRHQVEV